MGSPAAGGDRGSAKFRWGLTEGLLQFARAHFALSKPDPKTGKTRLKLLTEIKEQTGVVAPELANLPALPAETGYLWEWYLDLSVARSAAFSINAIAWTDIWAYFDLKGIRPDAWEIRTIRSLDEAFLLSRTEQATGAVQGAKALRGRLTGEAGGNSRRRTQEGPPRAGLSH